MEISESTNNLHKPKKKIVIKKRITKKTDEKRDEKHQEKISPNKILPENTSDSKNNTDTHSQNINLFKTTVIKAPRKKRVLTQPLQHYFNNDQSIEVGIDEAGRGPMFGRVYAAAVVLPKDDTFHHEMMKDSKRFHSEKKIMEAYEYIKKNAISYSVEYSDETVIDKINIRQATLLTMHNAIKKLNVQPDLILVDGNDFKPYVRIRDEGFHQTQHICIEGGDNKYTCIAAASILAKVERDNYIKELCKKNPLLDEYYGISGNKGYGTKKHLDGIKQYGISEFHRKTYGICRDYS